MSELEQGIPTREEFFAQLVEEDAAEATSKSFQQNEEMRVYNEQTILSRGRDGQKEGQ
jgi:hypothetical protein